MNSKVRTILRFVSSEHLKHGLLLSVGTTAVCVVLALTGSAATSVTMINLLVMLVAVIALTTFSGNSGILSFGHAGFMALGAQISATLTVLPRLKARLLPDLPVVLQNIQLDFWAASIITMIVVMIVAMVIGLGLMRLPTMALSLSTLGVLIIINSVLTASTGITRGNQAMHSISREPTIWVAAFCAAGVILIAYLYKNSLRGLELRASRVNEPAARSLGIDVEKQRLFAWVLSAGIAAAGVSAALMERIAFRPLRGASPMVMLLTSFAVAAILQTLFQVLISPRAKPIPVPSALSGAINIGPVQTGAIQVTAIVLSLFGLFLLSWLYNRSRIGAALRAAAEDFETVRYFSCVRVA